MEVIRSIPLYQQVYNQLRKEIVSGNVEIDSIINEVHLARDMAVSRGPVREAIRILEQEGLLVRDSKNQLRPYKPTIEDLQNIYQCRQVLESLAVKLAAERITTATLSALEDIIQAKQKLVSEKSDTEFIALSSQFHDLIIASSVNPRLEQQINQLRSLTYLYRQNNAQGKQRREVIMKDHSAILQLLQERNPEKASTFMSEHIERDLENLIHLYKNGNLNG